MKKAKEKYYTIADLVDEFHISRDSIEFYGVHGLLLPNTEKTNEPVYHPFDKLRLEFIARAKSADYTINDIKALIGELDLKKEIAGQIEESLVYSKQKYAQLKDSLEDFDVLEQINVTCDLQLLESYIKALIRLKYGLPDFAHSGRSVPVAEPEVITSIPDLIENKDSIYTQKSERKIPLMSLMAVLGLLFLAVSGYYLFLDRGNTSGAADKIAGSVEMEHTVSESETAFSSEAGAIGQPEAESIDLPETESASIPEAEHKEEMISLYTDLTNDRTSHDLDAERAGVKELYEAIDESKNVRTEPKISTKEDEEEEFFKQLVADLQKKYDEQAKKQVVDRGDIKEKISTPKPKKEEEVKETKSLMGTTGPDITHMSSKISVDNGKDAPVTNIAIEKKVLIVPDNEKPAPTKKTSLKELSMGPSKEIAELPGQPVPSPQQSDKQATDGAVNPTSTISPKPSPSAIQQGLPAQQAMLSRDNQEAPVEPKREDSKIETPLPPKPKPKEVPRRTVNPQALEWVQKSYENVMKGDAAEAIISATVALTLDPDLVNAYINRSWAYSKKGRYDRAIQDCNKALDIDPDNALAYNNRGLAFHGKGDKNSAKADYEKACELGFDVGCKNYQEIRGQ